MMAGDGDYGVVREDVMAEAQERAHGLALQGLSAGEIERALNAELTATERELLRGCARRETERGRLAAAQAEAQAAAKAEAQVEAQAGAAVASATAIDGRRQTGAARALVIAALIAVPALAGGIVLGAALTSGGGGRGARSRPSHGSRRSSPPHKPPPVRASTGASRAAPAPRPSAQVDLADAGRLNDLGFRLMSDGRYMEAVPLLRRAVAASVPSGADLTHAYALFNLGRSLRLAGRPREAIPLLERRLRINDQRETVARELAAARRDADLRGPVRPGSGG
jgi:tetratricopeptide (TPR) repeat protein